jgi:rusticyanin
MRGNLFMKDSSKVIFAMSLGVAFAVALAAPAILGAYPSGFLSAPSAQGSEFPGWTANIMYTPDQAIPIDRAIQAMQSTPSYASVSRSNNTVSFNSQNVSVFALAIMPGKAVNLTRMQPPSYSKGDVFVIYGLVNPTLVMPDGATVHFTVVNLDEDVYHNLVVSSIAPPYPYVVMQGMMSSFWSSWTGTTSFPEVHMAPFLPPADYAQGSAPEYSYTLRLSQPGNLWYLCTYPGHAEAGMYGQMVVGT